MDIESWIEITQQRARNIRASDDLTITNNQRVAILMIFKGIEREYRLEILSRLLGRPITSVNFIHRDEASLIVEESQTEEFREFIERGDFS